jgi:hypothetical protein
MTTNDRDQDGGNCDDGDEEEEPYSRLDPETAARCGLWLETE